MTYGNKNGKYVYDIPVEWIVTERINICANSLEEAIQFVIDKLDDIPLGTNPDYVDGTYKISADESESFDTEEIVENMGSYGYTERLIEDKEYITEI